MEFSSKSLVSRFLAGDNGEYEAWVRNVPGSSVAVDGFPMQVICVVAGLVAAIPPSRCSTRDANSALRSGE